MRSLSSLERFRGVFLSDRQLFITPMTKKRGIISSNDARKRQAMPVESPAILRYSQLVPASLLVRYKRFLADVKLEDSNITVHCPNTGPMTGLLDNLPMPAYVSESTQVKRKYAHTLEWVKPSSHEDWVGVHSAKANAMVGYLLENGLIPTLSKYSTILKEVKYGTEKSRVDFVLKGDSLPSMYVEVKSVTMQKDGVAMFPDTISQRAQRHMRELMQIVKSGNAATVLFLVQRGDCTSFRPCQERDPMYAALLKEALMSGVNVVAMSVQLDELGTVRLKGELPIII